MSKTIRTPRNRARHTNLRKQTTATLEGFTAEELNIKPRRIAKQAIDPRRKGRRS